MTPLESLQHRSEQDPRSGAILASGDFLNAAPNFKAQAAQTLALEPVTPNDPEYGKQRWHYEAVDLPGAVAALEGHNLSASELPIAAVFDTGIVASHPDLIVAGVLELLRWANPALTAQAIEELLRDGSMVDDPGPSGKDDFFGYGLINARKAVELALAARDRAVVQPGLGDSTARAGSITLESIRTKAEVV